MRTPQFGTTNAWFNPFPALPRAKTLSGTVKRDWVVLGAGVTGLAVDGGGRDGAMIDHGDGGFAVWTWCRFSRCRRKLAFSELAVAS